MGKRSRELARRRAEAEALKTFDELSEVEARARAQEVAPWSNTETRLRVPSGTDPLMALREAMGVFMERRDGTNAMEWWQRVNWWHGGPEGLKRGDWLLPPSETGIVPALPVTDKFAIYVTTDQRVAIMYAAAFEYPTLYQVTLREEPVRDDVLPDEPSSWKARRAHIYRELRIEPKVLLMARRALDLGASRLPDEAPAPVDETCPPIEEIELGQMRPIEG